MESLDEKLKAFHFSVQRVDGHDVEAICSALDTAKQETEWPSAIILDTVKGKDCVFAEGKFNHHITVSAEQAAEAIDWLQKQLQSM